MIPVSHDVLSHSANVTIAKVYKGMDSLKEMGIPPGGNVMVEKFGPETDPDECVADMSGTTLMLIWPVPYLLLPFFFFFFKAMSVLDLFIE